MTRLLHQAITAASNLPAEMQDDIARIILQLAGDESVVSLSTEERQSIEISKSAAARGEFATDDEVRAVWAKHGL